MKVFKLFNVALIASSMLFFVSCSDDKDDPTPNPVVTDGVIGNGYDSEAVANEITKNTVYKKGTYILKGWVHVKPGITVTFEPGTIVKGELGSRACLIIEPGAKIIAQGTPTEPIVFTSARPKGLRKPGDWGGLIILGKAKQNYGGQMTIEGGPKVEFGGDDDADNSGVLSYVRVEFAGYPFETDKEINGITFGGVGSGTKVDHVQVSYSSDDSFEWFGGKANAKYLVAYHGWDDDFDTDNGFSGKLQYLLGVRHPKIADKSLSNGFESDNKKQGESSTPKTAPIFSNVTFVGPIGQDALFENTLDFINGGGLSKVGGAVLGKFQSAMQIRRYSQLSCFNSVAMGYPVGLLLDNALGNTQSLATDGTLKISNVVFAQMGVVGSDGDNNFLDKLLTDATKQSFSHTYFSSQAGNQSLANISDLKLKQPNSLLTGANWGPTSGSPLTGKTGLFTDAMLADSFFDKVDFIGAFKSDADADNWLKGWTNFDPQNTDY